MNTEKWSNPQAQAVWKEVKKNSGQMLSGLTPTAIGNFERYLENLESDREQLQQILAKNRSLEAEVSLLKKKQESYGGNT